MGEYVYIVVTQQTLDVPYENALLAVSTYYGHPIIVRKYNDNAIFESLPEKQKTRAKASIQEQLSVIPRAKNMFWVYSYSDETITRYSVDITANTCTCYDYLYNCSPTKGIVCKHIWRIRFLWKSGAIPKENEDPYNWYILQLEEDYSFLNKNGYAQIKDQIKSLHSSVLQDKRWQTNFNRISRRRAEILSQLQFITIQQPDQAPYEYHEETYG